METRQIKFNIHVSLRESYDAFIVGSIIGVTETELSNSRGYIQNWLSNNKLTDKTAKRIFKVANDIIKYGKV